MPDYTFFKYRDINKYLIDALVKCTIHFSSPNDLNDPFDCRVDIKKAVLQAIDITTGKRKDVLTKFSETMESLLDQIQKDSSNFSVCSFSLKIDEPLLWSHYANKHKGVCLTYTFPESFLDNSDEIMGVAPISYLDNAMTHWFASNMPIEESDLTDFVIEVIKQMISIKSPAWAYEEEVRIIRQKQGPFAIERSHLKQICFGLDTSDADIELIKNIVRNADYSVNFCKIERSNSDFGIEAKEI